MGGDSARMWLDARVAPSFDEVWWAMEGCWLRVDGEENRVVLPACDKPIL
jgi:hypothetical protein